MGAGAQPLLDVGAGLIVGQPAVSLLVPTYNGSAFIGPCVESILAQTAGDFECLVYDDGSTDDTLALVKALTKGDRRFVTWRNPRNLGPHQNLMRLYEAARAPFVNWVLHDDVLHPEHLARLLPPLQQHEGLVLATAKRDLIDAAGRRLADSFPFTALTRTDTVLAGRSLGDVVLEQAANVIGETTSVVLRKGLVPAADLWQCGDRALSGVADVWLWLRRARARRRVLHARRPVVLPPARRPVDVPAAGRGGGDPRLGTRVAGRARRSATSPTTTAVAGPG